MTTADKSRTCCPKFDPTLWQEQEVTWRDKLFVKDSVPQIFHTPLPSMFGRTVGRMWAQIEAAGAAPETKDFLMLASDPSPWKSELHINVTKEVEGMENVHLSVTFLTKVFDGSFSQIRQWLKEMDEYVKGKGHRVLKYFVYYTTCPKCAKKYGHNYVVFFAQIA